MDMLARNQAALLLTHTTKDLLADGPGEKVEYITKPLFSSLSVARVHM